jgi:hypothetical protein
MREKCDEVPVSVRLRRPAIRKKFAFLSLKSAPRFDILRRACAKEISRMSTAWWLLFGALAWCSIGLVVALVVGRIFHGLNSIPEKTDDRLIC